MIAEKVQDKTDSVGVALRPFSAGTVDMMMQFSEYLTTAGRPAASIMLEAINVVLEKVNQKYEQKPTENEQA